MCTRAHARALCAAWRASDARAACDPDGVGFLVVILTLVLIGLVAAVVSAPLRRTRKPADARLVLEDDAGPPGGEVSAASEASTRDELEAAREAKYREIRDTELDFRTGKLSREDYQAIDADLRAEAIEILNRLEELRPRDA